MNKLQFITMFNNPAHIPVYGVSWNKSSNPALTRIGDSVGLVANAGVDDKIVFNHFDNIYPYSQMSEYTDASGNVFIRIPKFYIRKTDSANLKTWEISEYPIEGSYLPKCFGSDGYAYIGKYTANLDISGSKLESKSGTAPLVNKTIADFRTYAANNGAGYHQFDIHTYDILSTLLTIEFATLNEKSVMYGVSNLPPVSSYITVSEVGVTRVIVSNADATGFFVGETIGVGVSQLGDIMSFREVISIESYDASNMAINFTGASINTLVTYIVHPMVPRSGKTDAVLARSGSQTSNSDGKHPLKYRGIENLWGGGWFFLDGININNNRAYVCNDPDSYASDVIVPPYEQISYTNVASNNYIVAMGFDQNHPYAEFPTNVTGGSGSTYYCNYWMRNTGARVAIYNGTYNYGDKSGIRTFWFNNLSNVKGSFLCARLQYKAP